MIMLRTLIMMVMILMILSMIFCRFFIVCFGLVWGLKILQSYIYISAINVFSNQQWLSLSFILSSFRNPRCLVWSWQYVRDNILNLLVMDQNHLMDDFSENSVNVDIPLRNPNDEGEKSNKCNQCDYASSQAGNLRAHLKTHNWEKSNKCNPVSYTHLTLPTIA